ncbi:DUF1566 domain-containing protein [Halorhodospira halochloris]|uniref:Lcl C-terminal domain-containing protein n=1 Tax=Halorhodospira halochloris TaxID=1052 RepID=UPI001EE82417|nr:DUF1566 domain-containing protein [Halorhodospira halochloris]MCG5548797.1 DUF1566 domain-containing protein [Halorhodospira halochloris]
MVSVAVADIPSASDDCEADLVESTPSSDFTPLEDGDVVRHEPTGLEWRRCPEGMDWNDSGCDGEALEKDWKEALQHAEDEEGWRMPNINELRSIVERCGHDPAINQQVFPDTPPWVFWSASPYAGDSDRAWSVRFNDGRDDWYLKGANRTVRLVRDGQ